MEITTKSGTFTTEDGYVHIIWVYHDGELVDTFSSQPHETAYQAERAMGGTEKQIKAGMLS